MSEKKSKFTGGAIIPPMQKIVTSGPVKKGATIPVMQPVQRPQGSGQQGGGQGTSGNQGSGSSTTSGDKK